MNERQWFLFLINIYFNENFFALILSNKTLKSYLRIYSDFKYWLKVFFDLFIIFSYNVSNPETRKWVQNDPRNLWSWKYSTKRSVWKWNLLPYQVERILRIRSHMGAWIQSHRLSRSYSRVLKHHQTNGRAKINSLTVSYENQKKTTQR